MQGMMMHRPMKIADILTYAAEVHPSAEIVSVRDEGDIHRASYREIAGRVAQLAHGLKGIGVELGDRVATLAWNGHRHFELYYAISGIGAICHTINPRLSEEQMAYIIDHAQDSLLFVDITLLPIVLARRSQWHDSMRICVMTDRAHMPEGSDGMLCYEDLLDGQPESIDWPDFPEDTASAMCYTSGTTGNPKGSLYSHRSTVMHAFMGAVSLPKILREGSRILPVVPLFHANAWSLPYACPLTGASMIFPGSKLDGKSVFDLMDREKVFSAWGVPTVWMGLLAQAGDEGRMPDNFGHVVVGGSAAPAAMIETFEKGGVDVCHAWGMTEMSPIGTIGTLPMTMDNLSLEERIAKKAKQGRRVFGVDLKIVDEDGNRLPHDGEATGELFVRGNAIISGYYENPEATEGAFDADGWFATGDVAMIDTDGFLTITDRAKDLIKSGGEWISSIDMENAAMAHPKVVNAAAIAIPDEKWAERPMLVVVPSPEGAPDTQEVIDLLAEHFAKWQLPDRIEFVDELPLTATGKVSKLTLRKKYVG